MRISHEAIYQAFYVQGRSALRREPVACLRTGRPLRIPRAGGILSHVSKALEGTIFCRVRRYDTLLLEPGRFSLQRHPAEV